MALARLLRAAWREYERDYARYFAKAMVYQTLVSLIPLILLMLAALGLLLRVSEAAANVEQDLLQLVEARFGAELREAIQGVLNRLQAGSVAATFVSLIGLIWTASALFGHLRMTFRAIWKHPPPIAAGGFWSIARATVREKLLAFLMVLMAGMLLLLALLLIGALHWLIAFLSASPLVGDRTGWLLGLSSPLIIVPFTFALLFRYLPPVRLPWRHVWLASVLCAAVWLVATEVVALYGTSLGSSFGAYGAVGGVLLIMLWMSAVSQVLFFGGELCKVVSRLSGLRGADVR